MLAKTPERQNSAISGNPISAKFLPPISLSDLYLVFFFQKLNILKIIHSHENNHVSISITCKALARSRVMDFLASSSTKAPGRASRKSLKLWKISNLTINSDIFNMILKIKALRPRSEDSMLLSEYQFFLNNQFALIFSMKELRFCSACIERI